MLGYSPLVSLFRILCSFSPANGRWPLKISVMMQAKDQISAAVVILGTGENNSGAMYIMVPTIVLTLPID